jgi:hypothetical protein
MNEMFIRLDDRMDIDAFTLGGVDGIKNQKCEGPRQGGKPTIV